MNERALSLINDTWPIVVISNIVAISLRLTYLKLAKRKINYADEFLKLVFIIYILCLFQIVTYQDVSIGGMNLIPFKEIFRYNFGSDLFFENVIGNMALFIPYGIFIAKVFKDCKVIYPLFLSFIASLAIELTQLSIGRVFDVDDVILNVIGAVVGYYLYKLFTKIKKEDFLKKYDILLDILFILLVGGLIWLLIA